MKSKVTSRILSVLGIIVICVLSLVLLCNCVLLVKGAMDDVNPPSLFGRIPLVTLSGSMSGDNPDSFDTGALLLMKKTETEELKVGDVIAFFDPASKKNAITTHRIVELTELDGERAFYTKGDYNGERDALPVKAGSVIGKYVFHVNGLGNFALFLQEPIGMLLFIGVPVISFILYDAIRRSRAAKAKNEDTEALKAELERLRALRNDETAAAADPTPETESRSADDLQHIE